MKWRWTNFQMQVALLLLSLLFISSLLLLLLLLLILLIISSLSFFYSYKHFFFYSFLLFSLRLLLLSLLLWLLLLVLPCELSVLFWCFHIFPICHYYICHYTSVCFVHFIHLVTHSSSINANHSHPAAAVVLIVFLWIVKCIVKTIFYQI